MGSPRSLLHLAAAAMAAVAISTSAFAQAPDGRPALTLAFEPTGIHVAGAERNGSVLLLGMDRTFENYTPRLVLHEGVQAANGIGETQLDRNGLPAPSKRAVWFAIDLQSGRFVSASPTGAPVPGLGLVARAVHSDRDQTVSRLRFGIQDAAVFLIRPGVGAWKTEFADGTTFDADGVADGVLDVATNHMESIDDQSGAPPAHYETGDVVLVLDRRRLAFSIVRIGAESQ